MKEEYCNLLHSLNTLRSEGVIKTKIVTLNNMKSLVNYDDEIKRLYEYIKTLIEDIYNLKTSIKILKGPARRPALH